MTERERWVIVTDHHRDGPVFGRLIEFDRVLRVAVLEEAKMVFSWVSHPEAPGLFGLATHGPYEGSKVSQHSVRRDEITDVVHVIDCSARAVEAFKTAPWTA